MFGTERCVDCVSDAVMSTLDFFLQATGRGSEKFINTVEDSSLGRNSESGLGAGDALFGMTRGGSDVPRVCLDVGNGGYRGGRRGGR